MLKHLVAIAAIYVVATAGWMRLGSTIVSRTDSQDDKLRKEVGSLWGGPLIVEAPRAIKVIVGIGSPQAADLKAQSDSTQMTSVGKGVELRLLGSDISVNLHLDHRMKGLLWYATYRLAYDARYEFDALPGVIGRAEFVLKLPSEHGIYDDFALEVDGVRTTGFPLGSGIVHAVSSDGSSPRHLVRISYTTQGLDTFTYTPRQGVGEIRDFTLRANLDCAGFDFPSGTMSPTTKNRTDSGWALEWKYKSLISGSGIGIAMPKKLNPGPLAARVSFFAPVSMGFFFFLIFIIASLRRIRLHPMNYFFLAAAFFSFHLLLAYLVDHVSIHTAFPICSAVSIFLVASYMRIVCGNRFAFLECATAQVFYLVGFSYAFFFEGFTGLTITIGAIITLFIVMQMTARIDWSQGASDLAG